MTQLSTFATLKIFGRTALRRLINRSTSVKFFGWRKTAAAKADDSARTATLHRSEKVSLVRRALRMWFPAMALFGLVLISFNSLFVLLDSVQLDEARSAPVLRMSPENFERLKQGVAITDEKSREAEIADTFRSAFSSIANWQTQAGIKLAQDRLAEKGIAGFSTLVPDSRWGGTLAYLSPEGRVRGLRAVGLYLAFINFVMLCTVFGLMCKNISSTDPALTWLWQFPVSRRVLFTAKLVEYVFDSPVLPVAALFYVTILCLSAAIFWQGLEIGILLAASAAVFSAAMRLAVEVFITQRLGRRTRGAIVAMAGGFGGLTMLIVMTGCNAQFLVESFINVASAMPTSLAWNPFTAGIGTEAMMNQVAGWWIVAPIATIVACILSVALAVRLTANGLACCQDSLRSSHSPAQSSVESRSKLGVLAWKEWLQIRRQPELSGQVLATPLGIAFMLYIAGYRSVTDFATNGGANIATTILVGCSYMLMIAATQMLTSEFKVLWLLQCQPRPLADIVRSKARVWAGIAIALSVPFIVGSIVMMPATAAAILVRVPFLFAALWLTAELIFALTALAASVTNEQKVTFRRSYWLTALVVSHASFAIYSHSWWMQLGALATLLVLNAAVRERALVELSWLSEPVETPPTQIYPMHAIFALVGFQTVMGAISAALVQRSDISTTANLAISYVGSAVVVSVACWYWMWQNELSTLPAVRRGPVLKPICWGLVSSCAAGLAVTMFLRIWNVNPQLPANALTSNLEHAAYDKWCLFSMWVIAAPLFEEWIIRGLMYHSLRRNWSILLSVSVTALLFATLHPVAGCISLLTLGTMTALATEKTKRLWPSMMIHAGYNFMIWLLVII
ncbi:MAG TPA: CPBP family intramembrane glutamic endopeptidase [Lacipirellulaceae bacterium]|nr:CPBP family intramembrane glutamic endopeptidase [Lacipirellulaceae bacterium]